MQPPLPVHVVVMGVAGCGKSAVGAQVAARLALPLVEGDDFHPPGNIRKMQQGVPLTDADRAGWLDRLAAELAARPGGAVLTCSALKRVYRDALRSGATPVRFVHLAISPAQALQRVAARPGHFYPPSLVDSQFATLEDPSGEPGVRVFDGSRPVLQLTDDVVAALQKEFNIP
jgi:gluconokinase